MKTAQTWHPMWMVALTLSLFSLVGGSDSRAEDDARLKTFRGQTMGTTYMVKVFDVPADVETSSLRIVIDAELRRVNDEMSTYLKTSQISKFNASTSTDWFPVSASFVEVVEFAQRVARKTDGAFDVTIGPLVDAWNFGPSRQETAVPDPDTLATATESVGYQELHVRKDPPALKKTVPTLAVDLSAIAKGHGVDRVVQRLDDLGIHNVFVEIGGEVRTSGDKAGSPWKVGIQAPDVSREMVMLGHPMSTDGGNDQSMATSGDYRNYFESDGVRYSHTIDPRTSRPVTHRLASVSVVSDSCMAADAWATAINVLGPAAGLRLAEKEQLDVLVIKRQDDGYQLQGTGSLAQYAQSQAVVSETSNASTGSLFPIVLLTTLAFAGILCAMAVGVMFGRRSISGSCGGLANSRNQDGSVSCSLCSNPDDACRELRQRMARSTTDPEIS